MEVLPEIGLVFHRNVLESYNLGIERDRLRCGLGLIEFARTKELLLGYLPPAPAVVYDIGGGYGEYAWWLASLGYTVYLWDLSETNIRMSAELAAEYPGISLAGSAVCDAREVDMPDGSDTAARETLLRTVRLLDNCEDISGLSTHFIGVSVKN